MCQVSLNEAQHELNSLIQKLKTGEERVVYIVRDDNTVVKLTLSEGNSTPVKRLGIGKGEDNRSTKILINWIKTYKICLEM